MGENSAISWTDHTWNPWIGCTKVSPACDGCYAEAMMDKRYGRVAWGAPGKGAGTRSRTSASTWSDPLRWHRKAESAGTRPFVFCASLADIFDNQVPAEWRRDAFDVMRRTPRLVYLLLTKRPGQIIRLTDEAGGLPENVALGTTCEDQMRATSNLAHLELARLALRPLFTFGSFEPLLGPIEIDPIAMPGWIITGGETDQGGHNARPWHPDWVRALRDQAARAGIPFHHKQNGEWLPIARVGDGGRAVAAALPEHHVWGDTTVSRRVGKRAAGRLLDGVLHDARFNAPDIEE